MAVPDLGSNLVELFERTAKRQAQRRSCGRARRRLSPLELAAGGRRGTDLGARLRARGVGAGDRVLLVAENRPEWAIADLAIMAVGAITVPAYTTNTTETHAYLLNHSEAIAAVVSTDRLARPLLPRWLMRRQSSWWSPWSSCAMPHRCRFRSCRGPKLWRWASRPAATADPVATLAATTWPASSTSGTGGNPKGVMLTHGNILTNVAGALAVLETLDLSAEEVFLSFLPLSHAYEHTAGQFLPMAVGAQIYYADGLEALASNFVEVRPTVVACVPRLYEVMRQRILRMTARSLASRQSCSPRRSSWGARPTNAPRR